MRNTEEIREEAMRIPKEEYDLTAGEMDELHHMEEWDKIMTAFNLGAIAGAKSSVPDEADLLKLLDKLTPEQLLEVKNYAELLRIEDAADQVTACKSCGSKNLSKKDWFIVCEDCGAGGGVMTDNQGRVRLFWDYEGKYDR